MNITTLKSLQDKYQWYVNASEQRMKGLDATKTDREILKENKQVLQLIEESMRLREVK